jgi:hypothetical protein
MKMNVSMSMDFLKPVKNFFKKYTALLPSIAIAVAALLFFVPTMLIGKSVRKEMQVSKSYANQVSSLLRDVPSRNAPLQVKRYMDRLEEEANQIEMLAMESSMRDLVSYDVFPPKGTSAQLYITFGRQYRNRIEALLSLMNALDAPSDAEIRNQTGTGTRAATQYDQMGPRGMTGTRAATTAAANPMIEALCLKRAQEISVYANPLMFPWYEFWDRYEFGGQQQALEDCWDSQVTLWICEDIAQTISTMNAGSTQVSTSPVKRLLGVSFSAPIDSAASAETFTRVRTTTSREKPNYITSPSTAGTTGMPGTGTVARQSNFVASPLTGRAGDDDVDVIHFAFSVLVDNRYVMAFMKELCSEKQHTYREGFQENGNEKTAIHNQITILDTEIKAVEKQAPEHELYRYGNGAVMRVDLVCEYQFYRKGYDAIKPEPVKQALGQSERQDQSLTPGGGMPDTGGRRDMGPRGFGF